MAERGGIRQPGKAGSPARRSALTSSAPWGSPRLAPSQQLGPLNPTFRGKPSLTDDSVLSPSSSLQQASLSEVPDLFTCLPPPHVVCQQHDSGSLPTASSVLSPENLAGSSELFVEGGMEGGVEAAEPP